MGEFRMPVLGADMEVGTIVEWRVAPGDVVHKGDIVAVVDTDKSTIEVEVFEDATIGEILVPPGVEVPVGTPLAELITAGEAADDAPVPVTTEATGPTETAFVRASPLARRRAAEAGIDLGELRGAGPSGAVLATDLPVATDLPIAADVAVDVPTDLPSTEDLDGATVLPDRSETRRRAVGVLMARSAREIPHYYLATDVDLLAATDWLRARNETVPLAERIVPAALLLRAVATAATRVDGVNGTWAGDHFVPATRVHLGVAVALRGGGLVAPTIPDADHLDVRETMDALRGVVERARSGVLRSSDAVAGTITVTDLGDQGVDEILGVIHTPQVALVGFGTVRERPWAADGMLGVRPVVRASLAADHRVSDGRDGARFLRLVADLLQRPEEL